MLIPAALISLLSLFTRVPSATLTPRAAAFTPTFTPARPPAIPLAVKSPYLNTWLAGDRGILPGSFPSFWTGSTLGWQAYVRVDGYNYNWMGAAEGAPPVNQTAFRYTSTRSVFEFSVDGMVDMTVTFLSPVYPNDVVKQSLQFSYVNVRAKSADGQPHNIQLYMDVSGEFASGNRSNVLSWDYGKTEGVAHHDFGLQNQAVFRESNEQASWGRWYLATSAGDSLSYMTGYSDNATRGLFLSEGRLNKTQDYNFRAVNDSWPVFAFANDFGSTPEYDIVETTYTLGIAQTQTINFQGATANATALDGPWRTRYSGPADSVASFHLDWAAASRTTQVFDEQVRADSAAAAGDDYAAVTTLSVRQTFGALQPARRRSNGRTYLFLKEISSNSDIQTVDVIFPMYPIVLYLNPRLGRMLLDPLYENQEGGHYPNRWAIHDLGTFPNAVGYPRGNDEPMPLEECGNMIIMTLAYAQRTGDDAYLRQHWPRLQQWASYLVNDSLVPADQLSTDDFAGTLANQTNLALKGIVGLRAMADIARRAGVNATAERAYRRIADDYLSRWAELGINSNATLPHTTLSYGEPESHGLLYNLYADRLLGLGFVNQSVYDMQSAFYPTVALDFGVPLDTRHNWTKSDWEMFAAAIASKDTRDMFISKTLKWIDETKTGRPMSDLFDAETGGFPEGGPTFVARPVVGGTFALLALPK